MPYLYVEIRPGEGGDDAHDFALELQESLRRYIDRNGWTCQQMPGNRTLLLQLDLTDKDLKTARPQLKRLAGVHRIQRTPSSDSGRRHTSTASVAVLDELPTTEVVFHENDLRIDRMRGSGTGGQRRNKVETAIRLTHLPTGIVITRTSGRSQAANLADAKAQLLQDLQSRATTAARHERHGHRQQQTTLSEAAKDFTHCIYRDEVVRHNDGARWTVRAWRQGRLS